MVYRLMVLGGAAARAGEQHLRRQGPPARGRRRAGTFCEVVERGSTRARKRRRRRRTQRGAGFEAVGLTPWQPAFAVPAIAGLKSRASSAIRRKGERIADGPDLSK